MKYLPAVAAKKDNICLCLLLTSHFTETGQKDKGPFWTPGML